MPNDTCSIDGCERPRKYREWCNTHYNRWWKHGDVHRERQPYPVRDPVPRFWEYVDKSGECWLWTRGCDKDGYGLFTSRKIKERRTHRYSWVLAHGPIPDGMWVLHTCDNPPCVNPAHLWLGTVDDNNADKKVKGRGLKSHCLRGHEFTPANTYITASGFRTCRACHRYHARMAWRRNHQSKGIT